MIWVLDYLPAFRSDLSRFHGVRDIEEVPSETFFMYLDYITAYEGAVLAMVRKKQEQEKKSIPLPAKARSNHAARVVSAEDAFASISDGQAF